MGKYSCVAMVGDTQAEAFAEICEDRIHLSGGINTAVLYADISDMRLLNYNLILTLLKRDTVHEIYERAPGSDSASKENTEVGDTEEHCLEPVSNEEAANTVELSKLGYETENFFENLWMAYAKKSTDALFVTETPAIATEGDYFFEEEIDKTDYSPVDTGKEGGVFPGYTAVSKKGIAKLALYSDCVCLIPHNICGRRIPLCFATEPEREGFMVSLSLDTGEKYGFSRLGFNTDPFFERLIKFRDKTVKKWTAAHERLESDLEDRVGKKAATLDAFRETGACVISGLFAPDDEENFWIAAVNNGRAAVELVTDEDTAVYIYTFDIPEDVFILRLRHAMEAVKKNRRLIYITDEALMAEPLYRMAADRSPHVRFLRGCCKGRIVHTGGWEDRAKEFLTTDND